MTTDASLFQRLTVGLLRSLEQRDGACNVNLAHRNPVDRSDVLSWEQKYSCTMPDDLRRFYLTSDGLLLTWCIKMNDNKIPLGRMEINPLEKLIRIGAISKTDTGQPSLADIDLIDHDGTEAEQELTQPRFDHRSRIFELDSCQGDGKVCFVFRNTRSGLPAETGDVWFLDRSLSWHYLADNFTNYHRMMLVHLGLPYWWYAYTDIGLPPAAKQWFNLFCPSVLDTEDKTLVDTQERENSSSGLDVAKVFKGKSDKKKMATNPAAKKKTIGSAKASGTAARGMAPSSQTAKPPMR